MSRAGTWYFTKEELENSPSRRDGMTAKQEQQYRVSTCHHLQEVGKKLKLPQLAIATAIVFFHRFFARQSHRKYDRIVVATACLFLAGKVEEAPKKLNLVITTSHQVLVANQHNSAAPLKETSPKFKDLREKILAMERVLLQIIAFDMHLEHPYKFLMKYRNLIPGPPENIRQLVQIAWNFVNDSLRTTLALQHDARTTAVAALYLAFKFLKMQAPEGRPWWLDLHASATQDTLEDISNCILDLYNQDEEKKKEAAKEPTAIASQPNTAAPPPKPADNAATSVKSDAAADGGPAATIPVKSEPPPAGKDESAAVAQGSGPERHSPSHGTAARAAAAPY